MCLLLYFYRQHCSGSVVLFLFFETVSLYSPGWPWTHDPSAFIFHMLGLEGWTTMPSSRSTILKVNCLSGKYHITWKLIGNANSQGDLLTVWSFRSHLHRFKQDQNYFSNGSILNIFLMIIPKAIY
jgi:hypothetical protein